MTSVGTRSNLAAGKVACQPIEKRRSPRCIIWRVKSCGRSDSSGANILILTSSLFHNAKVHFHHGRSHRIIARGGEMAGIDFPIHPHMLRHAKDFQLVGEAKTLAPSKVTSVPKPYSTPCSTRSSIRSGIKASVEIESQNLYPVGGEHTIGKLRLLIEVKK